MRFTWDPAKAASNLRKHGVTFEEAAATFGDPLALLVRDARYLERQLLIGESFGGRILVTVFLETGDDDVRIVSTRGATRRERQRYEEGQSE